MTIKVSLFDIENIGFGEPRAYSGRGMYGRECLGLVVDSTSELIDFVITVTQEVTEWNADSDFDHPLSDFMTVLSHISSDSMGLSKIYYWPSVSVDSGSDD